MVKLSSSKALFNFIIRGQHITESIRDNLLTQSVLEVEALVKYCKNGDFARYFVYINNELNDLYQSIMDAIRDPA
jgi:lysyl-tRNA synthetase class II